MGRGYIVAGIHSMGFILSTKNPTYNGPKRSVATFSQHFSGTSSGVNKVPNAVVPDYRKI